MREEHRLGVFENRVLRRISVSKRNELAGRCTKLHTEVFGDLYSSPSMIRMIKPRRMRLVGHVTRKRKNRNAYRLLVGKPEERWPLGRPKRRRLNNIRMDLVEVGWSDVDWIGLARDRDRWRALVSSVLNPKVQGQVESSCEFGIEPLGSIKRWEAIECPNN
jgi:hypothetical protein